MLRSMFWIFDCILWKRSSSLLKCLSSASCRALHLTARANEGFAALAPSPPHSLDILLVPPGHSWLSRHTFEICIPFDLFSHPKWRRPGSICSSQLDGSQSVTFLSALLNFINGFLIYLSCSRQSLPAFYPCMFQHDSLVRLAPFTGSNYTQLYPFVCFGHRLNLGNCFCGLSVMLCGDS
jgi:hypothetical protein